MVEISDLTVQRGNFTASLPSLTIDDGECVALCGVSGSGKSTLVDGLALLSDTSHFKSFIIDRIALDSLSSSLREDIRINKICVMPQVGGLVPFLTIRENIFTKMHFAFSKTIVVKPDVLEHNDLIVQDDMFLVCDHASKKFMEDHFVQVLMPIIRKLGIEQYLDYYPQDLSIGQRQRALFIRTLATCPHFLLIDEPTAALDPDNAQIMFDLIQEISADLKLSVLIVTHDLKAVSSLRCYTYNKDNSKPLHSVFLER